MERYLLINVGGASDVQYCCGNSHTTFKCVTEQEAFPVKAFNQLLKHVLLSSIKDIPILVSYTTDHKISDSTVAMLESISENTLFTHKIIPLTPGVSLYDSSFFYYHNRPEKCEKNQLLLPFLEAALPARQR